MKHGLGWNINQPDTWSERETGKREKEGRERAGRETKRLFSMEHKRGYKKEQFTIIES